jgi:hypothetical protein
MTSQKQLQRFDLQMVGVIKFGTDCYKAEVIQSVVRCGFDYWLAIQMAEGAWVVPQTMLVAEGTTAEL